MEERCSNKWGAPGVVGVVVEETCTLHKDMGSIYACDDGGGNGVALAVKEAAVVMYTCKSG